MTLTWIVDIKGICCERQNDAHVLIFQATVQVATIMRCMLKIWRYFETQNCLEIKTGVLSDGCARAHAPKIAWIFSRFDAFFSEPTK